MADTQSLLSPSRPAEWSGTDGGQRQPATVRQRVHEMVEGTLDTWFEYSLLGVIFVNVLFLIVSTIPTGREPDCSGLRCERLGDRYFQLFEAVEWISVAAFSVEYIGRIWSCVEDPNIAKRGPFWGRLTYALSFYALVDLVSILPNWISFVSFLVDPFTKGSTYIESPDFTTAARIVRLVRIFKTDKYISAFSLLGNVLWENRILLMATSFYSAMMWIISSTLLYYTEADNPKAEMREHFQSIPLSMFPTILMLTGEYPLADFTPLGQFISGIIAVLAVAIFAVPTSVLGAGFMKAVQQAQHREFTMDMD